MPISTMANSNAGSVGAATPYGRAGKMPAGAAPSAFGSSSSGTSQPDNDSPMLVSFGAPSLAPYVPASGPGKSSIIIASNNSSGLLPGQLGHHYNQARATAAATTNASSRQPSITATRPQWDSSSSPASVAVRGKSRPNVEMMSERPSQEAVVAIRNASKPTSAVRGGSPGPSSGLSRAAPSQSPIGPRPENAPGLPSLSTSASASKPMSPPVPSSSLMSAWQPQRAESSSARTPVSSDLRAKPITLPDGSQQATRPQVQEPMSPETAKASPTLRPSLEVRRPRDLDFGSAPRPTASRRPLADAFPDLQSPRSPGSPRPTTPGSSSLRHASPATPSQTRHELRHQQQSSPELRNMARNLAAAKPALPSSSNALGSSSRPQIVPQPRPELRTERARNTGSGSTSSASAANGPSQLGGRGDATPPALPVKSIYRLPAHQPSSFKHDLEAADVKADGQEPRSPTGATVGPGISTALGLHSLGADVQQTPRNKAAQLQSATNVDNLQVEAADTKSAAASIHSGLSDLGAAFLFAHGLLDSSVGHSDEGVAPAAPSSGVNSDGEDDFSAVPEGARSHGEAASHGKMKDTMMLRVSLAPSLITPSQSLAAAQGVVPIEHNGAGLKQAGSIPLPAAPPVPPKSSELTAPAEASDAPSASRVPASQTPSKGIVMAEARKRPSLDDTRARSAADDYITTRPSLDSFRPRPSLDDLRGRPAVPSKGQSTEAAASSPTPSASSRTLGSTPRGHAPTSSEGKILEQRRQWQEKQLREQHYEATALAARQEVVLAAQRAELHHLRFLVSALAARLAAAESHMGIELRKALGDPRMDEFIRRSAAKLYQMAGQPPPEDGVTGDKYFDHLSKLKLPSNVGTRPGDGRDAATGHISGKLPEQLSVDDVQNVIKQYPLSDAYRSPPSRSKVFESAQEQKPTKKLAAGVVAVADDAPASRTMPLSPKEAPSTHYQAASVDDAHNSPRPGLAEVAYKDLHKFSRPTPLDDSFRSTKMAAMEDLDRAAINAVGANLSRYVTSASPPPRTDAGSETGSRPTPSRSLRTSASSSMLAHLQAEQASHTISEAKTALARAKRARDLAAEASRSRGRILDGTYVAQASIPSLVSRTTSSGRSLSKGKGGGATSSSSRTSSSAAVSDEAGSYANSRTSSMVEGRLMSPKSGVLPGAPSGLSQSPLSPPLPTATIPTPAVGSPTTALPSSNRKTASPVVQLASPPPISTGLTAAMSSPPPLPEPDHPHSPKSSAPASVRSPSLGSAATLSTQYGSMVVADPPSASSVGPRSNAASFSPTPITSSGAPEDTTYRSHGGAKSGDASDPGVRSLGLVRTGSTSGSASGSPSLGSTTVNPSRVRAAIALAQQLKQQQQQQGSPYSHGHSFSQPSIQTTPTQPFSVPGLSARTQSTSERLQQANVSPAGLGFAEDAFYDPLLPRTSLEHAPSPSGTASVGRFKFPSSDSPSMAKDDANGMVGGWHSHAVSNDNVAAPRKASAPSQVERGEQTWSSQPVATHATSLSDGSAPLGLQYLPSDYTRSKKPSMELDLLMPAITEQSESARTSMVGHGTSVLGHGTLLFGTASTLVGHAEEPSNTTQAAFPAQPR